MKPTLIVYVTREGQTRLVAEYLSRKLTERGMAPELIDAAKIPQGFSLATYSSAIVAASLHAGRHEPEMKNFVRQHVAELNRIATAFLSVSLSEVTVENPNAPPEKRAQAETDVKRTIMRFLDQTGWRPSRVVPVAGALMFSRYGLFTRLIMRSVAKKETGIVDTTRDHEFTDWAKLDVFAEEWAAESVQTV